MKIVITVNTYYPLKDGVQNVTEYHAEGLVKRGHNVVVITPEYGNLRTEIYRGVRIIRVNAITKHTIYYGDKEKYQKTLLNETKNADALINVCTQNPMTDWAFPILDEINCKKILYMHGMYDKSWNINSIKTFKDVGHKVWNNIRWGYYYHASKKYFEAYNHIVQLHEFDKAYVFLKKKYGIKGEIIENAVENIFFDEVNKQKTNKYLLYVANYVPSKNHEFVLKAFYATHNIKDYGLVLIGGQKNQYYNKINRLNEELEKKYGKRNVKILYGISRKDTIYFIKNATIFLMGSKSEIFPVAIIEAMASGIPFISTNVGCVRYLPGGIVVKNKEDMVYWIELLIHNENVRNVLGKVAREYAKIHMLIDNKVNELERLLTE